MLTPFIISLAIFLNLNVFGLAMASSEDPSSNLTSENLSSSPLTAVANLAGRFNVTGQVIFSLIAQSNSVAVSISITGLSTLNSTAAYTYHIHTNPISSNGDCMTALGHLDPLAVTDALTCNPQISQYCQEGDLTGRHGKLNGSEPTLNVSYVDDYLRFWPQPFSILGRSVVVHLPNSTRIACGNITSTVDGTATPSGEPTFTSSNYTTEYPSQAPPAPASKYEPFNGSAPNPEVLSKITLPSPLPTVQILPNVILGTNITNQTVDGKTKSTILPAALNASAPFTYTPGAMLPTQNATTKRTSAVQEGASSGVGLLIPPTVFHLLAGFCLATNLWVA